MSNARLQKWTAAPDWFRCKVTGPRQVKEALDAIRDVQYKDVQRASKLERWHFQGYKGMASGSVRWGIRDWSLIWESSGDSTSSTLSALQTYTGCALRIDLQVTLSFSSPLLNFGTSCLKSSTRQQTRRRRTTPLVGESKRTDGSYCGTVGRRSAHKYFRLYDKGVESKTAPPGYKWRLEMETKGPIAEGLCREHHSRLREPTFCANYCAQSWRSEGFTWPFDASRDEEKLIKEPSKTMTTAGALALWLGQTVKPTIPRLLTVFTVAEVLEMLGLQDVATPKRRNDA